MLETEANRPPGKANSESGDDTALVARTLDSAREVFDALVRKHTPAVFGFVMKIVKDPVKAESVVQTAFVKGWEHYTTFRRDSSFLTWIEAIAKHEAIAKPNKQVQSEVSVASLQGAATDSADPLEETTVDLAGGPGPAEQFENRRRLLRYVRDARTKLDPYLREVLCLYAGDFTDEDIEYMLAKSPHALRTYKSRIREQLSSVEAGGPNS
jgi:RNA polymerase sigma factor (sigma-70 family)